MKRSKNPKSILQEATPETVLRGLSNLDSLDQQVSVVAFVLIYLSEKGSSSERLYSTLLMRTMLAGRPSLQRELNALSV